MDTQENPPPTVSRTSRRRGAAVVDQAAQQTSQNPQEGAGTPKQDEVPPVAIIAAGEAVKPAETATLPKEEKPADTPKEEVKVAAAETASVVAQQQAEAFVLEGCFLASDVRLDNIKILIYGDSGSGKTHFGSGNGRGVLVLSLEVQGRATIRAANSQAQIFPIPPPPEADDGTSSMDRLRRFIKLISIKGDDSPLKKAGIHTIVIDSMTELQQILMEGILQEKRSDPKEAKKDGEKKESSKGPAPEFTRNDWGTLAVKQRTFMRVIRDCPYNVVILALCEPNVEENTGIRRLYPKIQGSFQENLPAYVNIIGYIYKGQKGERHVMVDGPEQYLCKSYGPIHGIVPADLMTWLDAIQKESPSIAIQGAKQPGQSGRRAVASANTTAAKADEKQEETDQDVDI